MKFFRRTRMSMATTALVAGTAMMLSACSSTDTPEETPNDSLNTSQEAPAEESVEIPGDTAVGEESQTIVDMLNADEDTTVDVWEDKLHPSFTAEVPAEDMVEIFNQNLRPAKPFTVTNYEGGDRQAVTTLTSPVSDPLDMTVVVDTEGLITGLFFGESGAAD
ncbi:MAG: hypothetical protein GX898_09940 [Corynebacterium sp.]|nr:hypothetical protein [Corynebacterium sp.]